MGCGEGEGVHWAGAEICERTHAILGTIDVLCGEVLGFGRDTCEGSPAQRRIRRP